MQINEIDDKTMEFVLPSVYDNYTECGMPLK